MTAPRRTRGAPHLAARLLLACTLLLGSGAAHGAGILRIRPDISVTPALPVCANCTLNSCSLPNTTHSFRGVLQGTVVNGDARACGRVAGEATKRISVPLIGSKEYGVWNAWTFAIGGPLTYAWSVPFKLDFELSGCVRAGWPVSMKNPVLTWETPQAGTPMITASHTFDFRTRQYFKAELPDGLDPWVVKFLAHPDRLVLNDDVTVHGDFADGTACLGAACVTLAGAGRTLQTSGSDVRGSGTLQSAGDNFIIVQTPAGTDPLVWKAGVDLIELAADILQPIGGPAGAVGLVFATLNGSPFDVTLQLDFGLGVKREDRIWLDHVRVKGSVAAVDTAASGETDLVFDVPITYDAYGDTFVHLPLHMALWVDANKIDPKTIVSYSPGSAIYANYTGGLPDAFEVILASMGIPPPGPDPLCVDQGDDQWAIAQTVQVTARVNVTPRVDASAPPDGDGDGVADELDNCPDLANAGQQDLDDDGPGDACDADDDNDGTPDATDNCPVVTNVSQLNSDADPLGDACDPDDDQDGIPDELDNCATTPNDLQANLDQDAYGDACDVDDDNDGVVDETDNCAVTFNPKQQNSDADPLGDACDPDDDQDGIPDGIDNCPFAANDTQEDLDGDVLGDVCDADDDADGRDDVADNCPRIANAAQEDADADTLGDVCDPDDDDDGRADAVDNCVLVANPDQLNTDGDALGNACDLDDDGDGIADASDACPLAWAGADADRNGCTDRLTDLAAFIRSLRLKKGVEASLVAKANAAAHARTGAAANVLDALLHEVSAQRGKGVPAAKADLIDQFVANVKLGLPVAAAPPSPKAKLRRVLTRWTRGR